MSKYFFDATAVELCVRAQQLRNCAKWHDRQAKRNPERASHHQRTARSLRDQANRLIINRSK